MPTTLASTDVRAAQGSEAIDARISSRKRCGERLSNQAVRLSCCIVRDAIVWLTAFLIAFLAHRNYTETQSKANKYQLFMQCTVWCNSKGWCPVGEVDRLQTLAVQTNHVELIDEVQPPTDERTTAVHNRSKRAAEACITSMLNGAHMVMGTFDATQPTT